MSATSTTSVAETSPSFAGSGTSSTPWGKTVERGTFHATTASEVETSFVGTSDDQRPTPRANATGYMGYTSYSTVIEETLSILSGERPDTMPGRDTDPESVRITPKILKLGVTVLRHVPHSEDGAKLFKPDSTICDSWIRKIAFKVLGTLYTTYGMFLSSNRTVSNYEELIRKICVNSSRPILDLPNTDDWLDQFCGPNLRWESLGLLFEHWDLGGSRLPYGDSRLREVFYTPATHKCLRLCIDLGQEFSDGNLFLVYLKYRRMTLESIVSGDASRQTWEFHADMIASLTFLGMHVEDNTPHDAYEPTLRSEATRRIVANANILDKVLVAFTGRPPLLSHKFVTTPMPLDLPDHYLFLDHASRLKKVRSTLDERGWNTEGGFYSSTYTRVRLMLAKIREKIAGFALGHCSLATIEDLQLLKAKQAADVAGFPSVLLWQANDLADLSIDAHTLFTKLLLRMETLLNEFFLERLLLRKGQTDEGPLLAASFELVTLVLYLWTHKDRFEKTRHDFEWLLVGYGAPGGGVLCKCLLKSPSSTTLISSEPHITRSAVIQKLSLLVGFLDWVKPEAPNTKLCGEIKLVIQQVLDQALNMAPKDVAIPDVPDWNFGAQLDFNFDLIDSFDWLRADFVA